MQYIYIYIYSDNNMRYLKVKSQQQIKHTQRFNTIYKYNIQNGNTAKINQ
jgi:hypothetical protein